MNELHLFSGVGGGILAGQLLGHRTVCAVEWEPYAQAVLVARQNDGSLPPFPIWDNVQNFDGKPWRGIVDIVCGGFPCQDISTAGKGAGIDGERSGMWGEMARIIGEVRPRFVFVENSPALTSRGLGRVLGDLAALGYDCKWGVLGASDVGAPHKRARIWIVANASSRRLGESGERQMEQPGRTEVIGAGDAMADPNSQRTHRVGSWPEQDGGNESSDDGACAEGLANSMRLRRQRQGEYINPSNCETNCKGKASNAFDVCEHRKRSSVTGLGGAFDGLAQRLDKLAAPWIGDWEGNTPRVASGVAHRSHRLKAIGNGQVSLCAATAFNLLKP